MSWLSLKPGLFSFEGSLKKPIFLFLSAEQFLLPFSTPNTLGLHPVSLIIWNTETTWGKAIVFLLFSYNQGVCFPQKVPDIKGDGEYLDCEAPKSYSLNPIKRSAHNSKFVCLGKGRQSAQKAKKRISALLRWGWGLLPGTHSSFVLCAQPWPIFTTGKPSILHIPPKWCLSLDLGSWLPHGPLWKLSGVNGGHEATRCPCRPPLGRVAMGGKRLLVVIKSLLLLL